MKRTTSYILIVGLTLVACLCSFCNNKKSKDGRTDTYSSGAISFVSDESFSPVVKDGKKSDAANGALDVKDNSDKDETLKVAGRVPGATVGPDKPKVKAKPKGKGKPIALKKTNATDSVFDVVDQMPSFPGGIEAMLSYISENLEYPEINELRCGIPGHAVVTCIVERDGSITDVKIVRSVDPVLDLEAIRVVKGMPKWTPGKHNGSAVRVRYAIPVSFKNW